MKRRNFIKNISYAPLFSLLGYRLPIFKERHSLEGEISSAGKIFKVFSSIENNLVYTDKDKARVFRKWFFEQASKSHKKIIYGFNSNDLKDIQLGENFKHFPLFSREESVGTISKRLQPSIERVRPDLIVFDFDKIDSALTYLLISKTLIYKYKIPVIFLNTVDTLKEIESKYRQSYNLSQYRISTKLKSCDNRKNLNLVMNVSKVLTTTVLLESLPKPNLRANPLLHP